MKKWYQQFYKDLWSTPLEQLSQPKRFLIYLMRVVVLTFRGFAEDQCSLRASALTLYSLFAIVPVLAMAFGLAKGFALDELLEQKLLSYFESQSEVISRSIAFAKNMLDNTRGGVIAGVGVLALFWTIVRMLANIEETFNHIWGVSIARPWTRKCSDYLSAMLICPFLVMLSSGVTVVIGSQLHVIEAKLAFLGQAHHITAVILKILPYFAIWALLTFLYIFMPNKRIQPSSGLIAGVITGTIFQFFQIAYLKFQHQIGNYGAIYGSFAALPLFLMWLQISWMIILSGAEISFAHQNVGDDFFEDEALHLTTAEKKVLILKIMAIVGHRFHLGKEPISLFKLKKALDMPARPIQKVLNELIACRLLIEAVHEDKTCYQPAKDLESTTLQEVLQVYEREGKPRGEANDPLSKEVMEALQRFEVLIRKSDENQLLLAFKTLRL